MLTRTRSLSTLLALLSVGTAVRAADRATGLDGVIRDPHGTPQMGVLVELLRGSVVATAFTDLQGRYHIAQVVPGVYDLRTSATLFLPTLHRSLLLRDGVPSTFNLTLTGLFDQTGWLTLPHKVGKGDVDDWRWTLRSPANRPMLRVVGDDVSEGDEVVPETKPREPQKAHAILMAGAYSGGYGAGASRVGLEIGRQSEDHRSSDGLMFSAGDTGAGTGVRLVAARETGKGQGRQRRLLLGVRSMPQVRTETGDGLTVVELDSAERVELGSMAGIEIGGRTQALRAGGTRIVMHPFVQVSAHANGVWLVRFQYATSPQSASFESMGEQQAMSRVPTLVQGDKGLLTEAGAHEELAVVRSFGQAHLEVAGFYDAERRAVLLGQLRPHGAVQAGADTAIDVSNGSFRKLVPGFRGDGVRVSIAVPLGARGQVTGAFINGVGVGERAAVGAGATTIAPRRASAVYVAVKHEVSKTGTRLSASYRWQPESMLTTVGLYELSDVNPYLGFHLEQALPGGKDSGWHTALVLDANNPFGQGYRSISDPTQDAQFVSALREMRAGLAVSF